MPEDLELPGVSDIYSLSACVNDNFADYIDFWKHNGYFLFDSPEIMRSLADEHAISLTDMRLFYYEAHDLQFHGETGEWVPFGPFHDDVNVLPPACATLEGFDITSFWAGAGPECSPLSCNGLATTIPTNTHCLLPSFEAAVDALAAGQFNAATGPYRVFAVYTVVEH